MKNILLILFATAPCMLIAQTDLKDVGAFTELSLGGNLEVTLIPSDREGVNVLLDHENLKINREGNKLKVSLNKVKRIWNSDDRAAKIEVYYRDLTVVNASAGALIEHQGKITFNTIELRFGSGAIGNFEVEGTQMLARAGEGADLKLEGVVDRLEVRAASGGHVKARSVDSKHVKAEASTGGMASVSATESIEADAHTGGMISYRGNPDKYNVNESLGGSVKGN